VGLVDEDHSPGTQPFKVHPGLRDAPAEEVADLPATEACASRGGMDWLDVAADGGEDVAGLRREACVSMAKQGGHQPVGQCDVIARNRNVGGVFFVLGAWFLVLTKLVGRKVTLL